MADKPDKRHVVFNRCLWSAPATKSTVISALLELDSIFPVEQSTHVQRAVVKTKSQEIRDALAAGDHIAALRIGAHFHDRSRDTKAYKRGFDAYNNPSFYRQLGHEPEELMADAIRLLDKNFR